jgi:FKBP-type peptidyl-prolyl cis-trans isomerase
VTVTFVMLLALACSGGGTPSDTPAPSPDAAAEDPAKAKGAKKEIPAPADVAAPPSDAITTPSGLAYKVLTPATNDVKPGPKSRVVVKYTGWTTDGKMFDSSEARGRNATFNLDQVIPGWTEGLQLMAGGQRNRFWVPVELAYKGAPGKPAGMLVFEVELVEAINPPPAPADVAAAPADATKTPSGLAYKLLEPGTGDSPTDRAKVMINFTSWSSDGTLVDTTVTKGRPLSLQLTNESMKGLAEAITLLKKGGHGLFWLPQNLAYDGKEGKPAGMIVYDISLLSFDNPIPPPDDVAAPPKDAKKTASGISYKILTKGAGGDHPLAESTVSVNYTGWTTDGAMFDTSTKRGKPEKFPLNRVIPGWTEGMQLMSPGDKARFWIPEELAYNKKPGKPAGMLVFDVELLSFENPPPPIPAPADVAAAPADATKTASGLAYKVLTPGTGTEKPTAASRVKVHYTGWTTDGKMFDSSVQRGEPAMFPLSGVIKGWTEGLQTMTVGGKTRFWIPADLAYGETPQRPGAPSGMLTFDVELLEILAGGPAKAPPHGKAPQ